MNSTLRQRIFAWILKKGDRINHQIYGHLKRDLFRDVRGIVVEVGPGSGVNFEFLPTGIRWIGIEPNDAFHAELKEKAKRSGIEAELISGSAANIPLTDGFADAILCTLVLCSVVDPVKAISEMKRIVRPGGKVIFIEHVAAPTKTTLRSFQNFFNPLNRLMADGCNCNRETWTALEQAGFSRLELVHRKVQGTMALHSPHILGFAIR